MLSFETRSRSRDLSRSNFHGLGLGLVCPGLGLGLVGPGLVNILDNYYYQVIQIQHEVLQIGPTQRDTCGNYRSCTYREHNDSCGGTQEPPVTKWICFSRHANNWQWLQQR